MAVPTETTASQPTCWTRSKGSRWVQEKGSRINIPPAPACGPSGLGTLSSHARFIPGCYLEGMGNCQHSPSHPCVLQPQLSPGSWCGLPSPCTEDPHLFCSIHPFLQAWNSYRSIVQERQLCLPWSSPPPALCESGSLPVVGGTGEKSRKM